MHVLIVSIGPVQESIESARKCRDLWFGSWLLSELARAAAAGIVAAESNDKGVLIFPGADIDGADNSIANKIVARIKGDPKLVAKASQDQMNRRLDEIRKDAFSRVGAGALNRKKIFHEATAIEQVQGMMEFLWASAPETDGPDAYKKAYEHAEYVLNSVKNSKVWSQPSWSEVGVPKSSLDGARESVLDEELYNANSRVERGIRRHYGVHSSERLCGVGLLKRFGLRPTETGNGTDSLLPPPHRIFSASHIASAPFRCGFGKLKDAKTVWDSYREALRKVSPLLVADLATVPKFDALTGRVDGCVFYEGRLADCLDELGFDRRHPDDEGKFVEASRACRRLLFQLRGFIGEPNPYYAILLADGDRMGGAISAINEFEKHQQLSRVLEEFATSTRRTVADHEGALIYSGGDDVMALLPLHSLLDCTSKLADDFAKAMKDYPSEEVTPTLSMGVVIVHHLMPLGDALQMVRKTEKEAKSVDGKDALAIHVQKRGGDGISIKGKRTVLTEVLRELVTLHSNRALSIKTQYELMEVQLQLCGEGDIRDEMKPVIQSEVWRILMRKRRQGGREIISPQTEACLRRHGALDSPAILGRQLYVAKILANAIRQANPVTGLPKEEKQ